MADSAEQERASKSGNLLPWFWIGAGIGIVIAVGATVMTAEFTRRRYLRKLAGLDDEADFVDDLTAAIHHGIYALTEVADQLVGRASYSDANRERIRYGLDPSAAGAGSSGWYTGDDEE